MEIDKKFEVIEMVNKLTIIIKIVMEIYFILQSYQDRSAIGFGNSFFLNQTKLTENGCQDRPISWSHIDSKITNCNKEQGEFFTYFLAEITVPDYPKDHYHGIYDNKVVYPGWNPDLSPTMLAYFIGFRTSKFFYPIQRPDSFEGRLLQPCLLYWKKRWIFTIEYFEKWSGAGGYLNNQISAIENKWTIVEPGEKIMMEIKLMSYWADIPKPNRQYNAEYPEYYNNISPINSNNPCDFAKGENGYPSLTYRTSIYVKGDEKNGIWKTFDRDKLNFNPPEDSNYSQFLYGKLVSPDDSLPNTKSPRGIFYQVDIGQRNIDVNHNLQLFDQAKIAMEVYNICHCDQIPDQKVIFKIKQLKKIEYNPNYWCNRREATHQNILFNLFFNRSTILPREIGCKNKGYIDYEAEYLEEVE